MGVGHNNKHTGFITFHIFAFNRPCLALYPRRRALSGRVGRGARWIEASCLYCQTRIRNRKRITSLCFFLYNSWMYLYAPILGVYLNNTLTITTTDQVTARHLKGPALQRAITGLGLSFRLGSGNCGPLQRQDTITAVGKMRECEMNTGKMKNKTVGIRLGMVRVSSSQNISSVYWSKCSCNISCETECIAVVRVDFT